METVTSKAISRAEKYLEVNFKPELNEYMINKFRKYVSSSRSCRSKPKSVNFSENSM